MRHPGKREIGAEAKEIGRESGRLCFFDIFALTIFLPATSYKANKQSLTRWQRG
jgi:hypothetical protein